MKLRGAPEPPAPRVAWVMPVPALDLAGQLALPPGFENSLRAQWTRPLPEIFAARSFAYLTNPWALLSSD